VSFLECSLTNIFAQTLQDELSGAQFHPLDDNLVMTYGKSHLAFWTRRKDGFFERTDLVKPVIDFLAGKK